MLPVEVDAVEGVGGDEAREGGGEGGARGGRRGEGGEGGGAAAAAEGEEEFEVRVGGGAEVGEGGEAAVGVVVGEGYGVVEVGFFVEVLGRRVSGGVVWWCGGRGGLRRWCRLLLRWVLLLRGPYGGWAFFFFFLVFGVAYRMNA